MLNRQSRTPLGVWLEDNGIYLLVDQDGRVAGFETLDPPEEVFGFDPRLVELVDRLEADETAAVRLYHLITCIFFPELESDIVALYSEVEG